MRSSIRRYLHAVVLAALWAAIAVPSASAAELPAYEFDPTLSLRGDCKVDSVDPVPDPSCTGEPLAYPAPPNGPTAPFREPRAIAIDSFGNEYVATWADSNNAEGRIDVFDDEGLFLTELAAPNAKSIAVDSKGNLYVFEDSGSIVRYPPSEYEPESGDIAYANPAVPVATKGFVGAVAVDPTSDQLFVASSGTITRYKSALEGSGELESFSLGEGASWAEAIAVDGQRKRIYVTFCDAGETTGCGVQVLERDAPHAQLKVIQEVPTTPTPTKFAADFARMGLAVDEATGDFFIGDIPIAKTVYQFDEDFEYLSRLQNPVFQANISVQIAVSNGKRSLAAEPCEYPGPEVPAGDACNRHYLFVPVLEKSNARAMAFRPPAETPPVIEEVSTGGIGETEAELIAEIFPGGLDTEYEFQITTQAKFDSEGFAGATTVAKGTVSGDDLTTEVSANATGLTPGESYRFRAIAKNDLGEAPEEGQNEASFATYDDAPTATGACANDELRTGPSARLPDCRAYELVTPADTSGRPPKGVGPVGNLFPTVTSTLSGDALWFRIAGGSLDGSSGVGSFDGDPYVARRGASGWTSTLEGPSGEEATVSIPGSPSPDQGYSFWTARIEGPLVIGGIDTEYVRYPDGRSELIGRGSLGEDPRAKGRLITEDGSHIVFETRQLGGVPIQLEEDAAPTGTRALYDRTPDEVTHVVSMLPGNVPAGAGQDASYVGASPDGEGIAFSIGSTLYLRVGNAETHEVATGVEFAGVSEGGDRVFYLEGGDLKALDASSEEVIEFSETGDVTPVNVSTGGTRAYFVSPSVLGGENPEGAVAQPGEQNLYLSEEGTIAFVGTVTDRDVEGEAPPQQDLTDGLGLWTDVVDEQPARDPSRTNPDGSVLLFQSRANLTGYDPGDSPQVFRYDSGADRLDCVSCIPTGVPAEEGASLEAFTFDAYEPPPLSPRDFVHNLNPAGNRVFFESTEALVSSDTDEVRDVYEWEAQGVGSCTRAEGCVFLISSGQSAKDNFLYAHSTSGDDVFFSTEDSLLGVDTGGAASIYDAKVGGGFAEATEEECIADGCRPDVTPAPGLPVPAKPALGADDDVPKSTRKTCPKGKRKVKKNGKVRCVKKKQKKQGKKGRAGTSRGAGK